MTPAAAVVVRTRDEVRWVGRVLDAVLRQTVPAEVVVVDSGSTDGTLDAVVARPVRLLHIAPGAFSYGRALNLGIAATRAPVAVALSAHALPCDERWLERLLAPFGDPTVAATYGRHLPHRDLDPCRSGDVLRHWGDRSHDDRPDATRYSNANGAVRRVLWERQAFDEALPASEDAAWAEWALRAGHRVVYVADAAVLHSHREGLRDAYRRRRALAAAAGAGPQTAREAVFLLRTSVGRDLRRIAPRPQLWRWAAYSPLLRSTEVLADRAGRRDGAARR